MTRAGKRLSTPRRTAPKIKEGPVANSDPQRALAFLRLETLMHDLYCMAEIAEAVIDLPEVSAFASFLLCEKVRDLRTKYRADLHAKPVQS
jgi:hypothetical protein